MHLGRKKMICSKSVLMSIHMAHHVHNIAVRKNDFENIFFLEILQCSPYLCLCGTQTKHTDLSTQSWVNKPMLDLAILHVFLKYYHIIHT